MTQKNNMINQSQRGMQPQDAEYFSPHFHAQLFSAVAELSWLLTRGYAEFSSLKLVGDRHSLAQRQRILVSRASCTDHQQFRRQSIRVPADCIADQVLFIDGFNLLINVETALGGGLLFFGRDGALRDIGSVHGAYRSVEETDAALVMIGECLVKLQPKSVCWLLDQPVSNSGRLAQKIRSLAEERHWPWNAKLVMNPDRYLMELSDGVVFSSDSLILDHIQHWLPCNEMVLGALPSAAGVLDFRESPGSISGIAW
jgi:hypothetical protein